MSVNTDLKEVFHEYVKSAAGGKQLSAQELAVANDKAISKLVKDCFPDMKTKNEASVFPKLCDRTTKKLHIDVFMSQWFLELAKLNVEEKEKRKATLEDPAVVAEADKLKGKVAQKAHEEKASGTKNAAVVDRLTDTSHYTGSHKERFDESGKGKGAAGREDEVNTSGYVGNYKGAGTFDGTH